MTDTGTAIQTFIAERWDPDMALVDWRRALLEAGWLGTEPPIDRIVDAELSRAGVPGLPAGVGTGLAAPAMREHGSAAIRDQLLEPILLGEHTWCQLFSEPGSGSDLAGLTTRADEDGDEWIVNGQKLWSTSAHHADYGLLLARTDWDVPKHRGITCFALPMHQPGVEVRPLRQMNGYASFNEIFITDARIPAGNEIGAPGDGWAVATTVLAHERRSFAALARRRATRVPDGRTGRAIEEAAAEADAYFQTYVWYPQRAGRPDLLRPRAEATGAAGDPIARQLVARVIADQRAAQWNGERFAGGPIGSVSKLAATVIARGSARAHSAIGGAAGMLAGPDAPLDGIVTEVLISVPAISIAGGTDEVQRNIVGERVLGLPKEPSPDKDLPFRSVLRNPTDR